jgi:hypothetical protein
VPLSFIATFNRVKQLTSELSTVASAVRKSSFLELDQAGTCIRPKLWQSLKRKWTEQGWIAVTPVPGDSAQTSPSPTSSVPLAPTTAPHSTVRRRHVGSYASISSLFTPIYKTSQELSVPLGMVSATAPYSTLNYYYPQLYTYPTAPAPTISTSANGTLVPDVAA